MLNALQMESVTAQRNKELTKKNVGAFVKLETLSTRRLHFVLALD